MDGETYAWANGKALLLREGDFIQAPPRHLHGFKMTKPYNRFVGFLTPGIFEEFFTRGRPGQNGAGGRGAGEGAAVQPRFELPPGVRPGGPPGAPGQAGPGGPPPQGTDIFRLLSGMGRGPDGYPLDVHGAKFPLPPQDPIWTQGQQFSAAELKTQYALHGMICSGGGTIAQPVSPELAAARRFKPAAESFI
jgi:hypothetical protein